MIFSILSFFQLKHLFLYFYYFFLLFIKLYFSNLFCHQKSFSIIWDSQFHNILLKFIEKNIFLPFSSFRSLAIKSSLKVYSKIFPELHPTKILLSNKTGVRVKIYSWVSKSQIKSEYILSSNSNKLQIFNYLSKNPPEMIVHCPRKAIPVNVPSWALKLCK